MKFSFYTCIWIIPALCFFFPLTSEDYEAIADKILISTAKQLQQEKNLELLGTGGGMIDSIKCMGLHCRYRGRLEIKEARRLMVESVELFLSNINEHEKVRPYLCAHPFPVSGIDLMLAIKEENGSRVPSDQLSLMIAMNGDIWYHNKDPKMDYVIHRERYEEALAIVQKEKEQMERGAAE
jgi:hypothetical protein